MIIKIGIYVYGQIQTDNMHIHLLTEDDYKIEFLCVVSITGFLWVLKKVFGILNSYKLRSKKVSNWSRKSYIH